MFKPFRHPVYFSTKYILTKIKQPICLNIYIIDKLAFKSFLSINSLYKAKGKKVFFVFVHELI